MKWVMLSAFVICGLSQSAMAQGSCEPIALGKFYIDGNAGKTTIKRTEDFQFERNKTQRIKQKLKIEWIGDCTYKLTLVKANRRFRKQYEDKVAIYHPIIVNVTDMQDSYYTQESFFEGGDQILFRGKVHRDD